MVAGIFPLLSIVVRLFFAPFSDRAPLGRRCVWRGNTRWLNVIVQLTPGDEAVTIRSFFATVSVREALFEKRRIEVDRGI